MLCSIYYPERGVGRMYLIVGLGNPGPQYEGSRHNLGYRVIQALAGAVHAERPTQKYRSLYACAQSGSDKILLAQPLTYMNRSGSAVAELLRFCSLTPEKLMVIFDDLDLAPGKIRIRHGGGSAGHRGVQSVINSLGTPDFIRVRIGIGKPPPDLDTAAYVLERASAEEQVLLNQAVERAVEAVQVVVQQGLSTAMNQFNKPLPG
jgi:peptidyl-tRNA hydrolase, PTH1 family